MRIDKFLWCVRIYKSRSLAADECRKGRIAVNGLRVKPSFEINMGQRFEVSKPPAMFTYTVREYPKSRVSAKLVPDFLVDETPREESDKLMKKLVPGYGLRNRGLGRPTKRERRDIDRLRDDIY